MSEPTRDGDPPPDRVPAPWWLRLCLGASGCALLGETWLWLEAMRTRDGYMGLAAGAADLAVAPMVVFVGLVPTVVWTVRTPSPRRRPLVFAIAMAVALGGEIASFLLVRMNGIC